MFVDRVDAGRQLGVRLAHLVDDDVVVVGLPRGGLPVAWEVAKALKAPLDVILVRKLGLPFQPEVGMGAIGENGHRIINADVVDRAHLSADQVAAVEREELVELYRRGRTYRSGRRRVPLTGRVVVVVDDGVATGSTANVACQVARAEGASRVILAVPVAPPGWTERMIDDIDEQVSLATPCGFRSIGQFYDDFTQVSDADVIDILDRAEGRDMVSSSDQALIADHEVQPTRREPTGEVG